MSYSPSCPQAVHVTMPLQVTFWGAYFGSCTDKFGINWQLDFELSTE